MDERTPKNLPEISVLFSTSWNLLKRHWIHFLVLVLISGLGFGLLYGILIGSGVVLFRDLITSADKWGALLMILSQPATYVTGGVLFLLLILGSIIIGSFAQVGMVLIIHEDMASVSYGELFKRSIGFIIPLAVVSILSGLLVFGGMWLFVIPGIVIAILLSFSSYEVIIEGKRGVDALSRSMYIVSKHFWDIVGRAIVLWLVIVVISVILEGLVRQNAIFSLLSTIFNVGSSWFSVAYFLTLYKEAQKSVDVKGRASLTWVVLVAVIGWILFFLVTYSGVKFFTSDQFKQILQQEQQRQMEQVLPNDTFQQEGSESGTMMPNGKLKTLQEQQRQMMQDYLTPATRPQTY